MKTWYLVIILCALMLWGCWRVDKWAERTIKNYHAKIEMEVMSK